MTVVMSERRVTVTGACLVAMGSVSLSIYTPAMPQLVEVFHTSIDTVKLTMTLYFAGFAFSQLVAGPLSDAFGRRPAGLGFLVLYLAASLMALLAPSIEWLIVARLLQGIGASAGVAMARAVVRDLYTGQTSARVLTTISMLLSVGPAIAPTIGGLTMGAFGWQVIFLILAIYAAVNIALVVTMPETLASRDPSRARPRRLAATYGVILADPRFLQPGLTVFTSTATIYTLSTLLPFALIDRVGLTPFQFGIGMLLQSGSYFLGSLMLRQLLRYFPADTMLPLGLGLLLIGALLLAVVLRIAPPSYLAVMAPVAVLAVGASWAQPVLTTKALAPFSTSAGSAAAMFGFMQIGGGLAFALLGTLFANQIVAIATVIPLMAVLACASHLALGRVNARRAIAED